MSSRGAARRALALLLFLCGGTAARAQDGTLLVLSESSTAGGDPASLELLAYDPVTLDPLAPALRLPGTGASGGIATADGVDVAAIVTTDATARGHGGGAPQSHLTLVRLDRWRRVATSEPLYSSEWSPVEIRLASGEDAGDLRAVLLAGSNDAAWTGVITFNLRRGVDHLDVTDLSVHRIAGVPSAINVDWESGRAYTLSTTYWGETLLTSVDWRPGRESTDAMTVSLGTEKRAGRGGIAALRERDAIAVLTSRRDAENSGRTRSTLQLFDARTLQPANGEVEIAGGALRYATALVRGHSEVWAATFSDSGAFAYATGVRSAEGLFEKFAELATTHAGRPPLVAVEAGTGAVAIAAEDSLRILDAAGAQQARSVMRAPIGALGWCGEGLIAGAGPNVVRLDPSTGGIQRASAPGRGYVVGLAHVSVLPKHSASATVDGLPVAIHLDGGMPGRTERIIPLTLEAGQRITAEMNEQTRQWLRVAEVTADERAGISLSLRDMWSTNWAQDRLTGSVVLKALDADGRTTPGGEVRIDVTASWSGTRAPMVQWQLSGSMQTSDGAGADSLRRILAGSPLHFSHRSRSGPLIEPPDASIVVIDLDAAAEGAMTRQVLLDYVARGGGLLFVGRHAPEQPSEGLRRWLEPLDVQIEADRLVDGRFAVDAKDAGLLGVEQLAVASGCYIAVSGAMDAVVTGESPRNAALAMRRYGYGRIALLASPTPLEATSLARTDGRLFARGLFGWLAGAQFDVRDVDFDGLPDRLEDSNGNLRADQGETSFLNPDTDGDGLPDGAEDSNFNGRVDEGETDPRLADTDADGLLDGADADPLPAAGTPMLASIDPAHGPAEGGTMVEVTGRNLPPSPEVWFGESRSPHVIRIDSTRVLAATPEQPGDEMEATVPVRIANRPGALQAALAGGFTFRDRSRARLALESLERTRRAYDGYRGQYSLVLELPDVRIDEVRFGLWIEPGLEAFELNLERSAELVEFGRTVSLRRYGLYEYRVTLGPGDLLTGRVTLGTLTFRLSTVPAPVERLRAFFRAVHVRAQWGGVLSAATEEAWIELVGAEEDVAQSDDSRPAPG